MKRRAFLKTAGLFSIASIVAPSTALSACRKKRLPDASKFKGKVLIVGAGAAGLYAGYLLKAYGIDFEILEAANLYGGRLARLDGFADYPLDLGAQWLHGKNNILGDLVSKTKTKITLDESYQKYWFNNQLVSNLPQTVDIFEGDNLPDVSYKDYAVQKGLGEDYKYIIENIAGDQGAAASKLSVYYNNKEEENWNSGDDDFKFEQTFFDVFDQHIVPSIKDKIRLKTHITQINYTSNQQISIKEFGGTSFNADKVIITVPISVLKTGTIQFIPELPAIKTAAFNQIGMGAGMKVFLKFTTAFYDENIIGGKICAAYASEKVGKKGNDNVLLAFIMGEQAEALSQLPTEAAVVNTLLQELDSMYNGQATNNFVKAHIQDWSKNPFIGGAYSYSTIGMGDARKEAAKPLDDKVFFAGEAMNTNGHHQTVHGAVETGYKAVMDIIKTAKK